MGIPKDLDHTNQASLSDTRDLRDLVVLGATDLCTILSPAICLAALQDVYRRLQSAADDSGQSIGFSTDDGMFHVKAGLYPGTHTFFAAKVNANFPDNPSRFGLPTIQGLIVLCKGSDGQPVAVLQSGELTGRRTAAATALATLHGARSDSRNLAIIGCGAQARHQVEAVMGVRSIKHVITVDLEPDNASALADWVTETFAVSSVSSFSVEEAVLASDIVVTCTTGTRAVITSEMVPSGCFIAAVGADNPDKQELHPDLFNNARILVDDVGQCARGGDLAHAIRAGVVTVEDVAATLAELAARVKSGRMDDDQIVIFDSTGTGVQDVAVATAAYLDVVSGRNCVNEK